MRRSSDIRESPRSKQFGLHLQPMCSRPIQKRKLSCEEIINEMEKEQDAQVMRLLREVDMLREENMLLRKQLYQGPVSARQSYPQLQGEGFTMDEECDANYHYGLSSGSTRSSISYPQRKPSPVGIQTAQRGGGLPIDTMMPTLSLNLKRGSTSAAPNSSSSSSITAESESSQHLLKSGMQEADPRYKMPRRYSSVSNTNNKFDRSHVEATRRLREYEFESSRGLT